MTEYFKPTTRKKINCQMFGEHIEVYQYTQKEYSTTYRWIARVGGEYRRAVTKQSAVKIVNTLLTKHEKEYTKKLEALADGIVGEERVWLHTLSKNRDCKIPHRIVRALSNYGVVCQTLRDIRPEVTDYGKDVLEVILRKEREERIGEAKDVISSINIVRRSFLFHIEKHGLRTGVVAKEITDDLEDFGLIEVPHQEYRYRLTNFGRLVVDLMERPKKLSKAQHDALRIFKQNKFRTMPEFYLHYATTKKLLEHGAIERKVRGTGVGAAIVVYDITELGKFLANNLES